ncbi:replication initiation protein [Clostridium sp. ZS2-4]|uniref:replication initiation protein n=1 Tax=Clostridium sp. ZS2-4 TaxID=2987703 RepID=UPI00227CA4A6|nr:replication initiation protein [Clostridium sp. ZS2-4]MCY6354833.1 replication initiation protein [Clostridium sp. ZS2-4]
MTINLTSVNDNWIYQSNKLIEASYTLTVLEQKLLRILASMIKKDDEDFKEYEFKIKDLMKILNTTNKRFYRDIDNLTDLLMQRIIKIKDGNTNKFTKYHWVDVAKYNNGILKLKINPDLKPFYLSLDWYTKYQLKNVLQFKSAYSFRVYELLKQYQKLKERNITIDDLRTILDISKNQYTKYANLKQKVIKVAVNEINEKTDLNVQFEEIKESRKIVALKFLIHSTNSEIAADVDIGVSDIDKIKSIFKEDITGLEAKKLLDASKGNMSIIKEKYEMAKQCVDISNVVGWVISAIKQDYKKPQQKLNKGTFDDYEQREYDFDELEKKLLGWRE